MTPEQLDASGVPYAFTTADDSNARPMVKLGTNSAGTPWIWDGNEHSILHFRGGAWAPTPDDDPRLRIIDQATGTVEAFLAPLPDWEDPDGALLDHITNGREALETDAGKEWLEDTLSLYEPATAE